MQVLPGMHVYLCWLQDHPTLSAQARPLVTRASEVHVRSASIEKANNKARIGKLAVDGDALAAEITRSGFYQLSISAQHAVAVRGRPAMHNDPFDRLSVAQALAVPLWF